MLKNTIILNLSRKVLQPKRGPEHYKIFTIQLSFSYGKDGLFKNGHETMEFIKDKAIPIRKDFSDVSILKENGVLEYLHRSEQGFENKANTKLIVKHFKVKA